MGERNKGQRGHRPALGETSNAGPTWRIRVRDIWKSDVQGLTVIPYLGISAPESEAPVPMLVPGPDYLVEVSKRVEETR